MKKLTTALVVSVIIFTGCASVRPESKAKLQEAKENGLSDDRVEKVSPGLAAGLNVLPGIGNIYIAVKSDESYNWALFVLNLCAWPISIVWAVPQAAIDGGTINKQATADYYMYDKNGKAEFEKAKSTK